MSSPVAFAVEFIRAVDLYPLALQRLGPGIDSLSAVSRHGDVMHALIFFSCITARQLFAVFEEGEVMMLIAIDADEA